MTKRRAWIVVPAVCLALLTAASAGAAESALQLIPKEALGFGIVNRLADSDAKLTKLSLQMQIPNPGLLGLAKSSTGVDKGLDENGSAVFVAMPGKHEDDDEPIILAFFPVTDFQQFIKPLKPKDTSGRLIKVKVVNARFLVAEHKGYAAFAEPQHRDVLKRVLDSPNNAAEDLAPHRKWLAETDGAVVAMSPGLKLISVKMQEELRDMREMMGRLDEESNPAIVVLEMYASIFKFAGEEVHLLGYGARMDKQGTLHVTTRIQFTPGGKLAEAMASVRPPKEDLLAGLPGGPFVAAGGGLLPEGAMEGLIRFSADFMKAARGLYGLSDEQAEKFAEISTKNFKDIRSMSMMLGVGKLGDPVYSNILAVMRVDGAKQFLAKYKEMIAALNEFVKAAKKHSILGKMHVQEVTVGGLPGLQISMDYPQGPWVEDTPEYEQIMAKMFGPGGRMNFFLVAADEQTVLIGYTNKALLLEGLKLLKQSKPGLAGDGSIARTARLLPSGAQWVGYWSPKGTIDFINRVVPMFTPPGVFFKLPEFDPTPPIGFSVVFSAAGLEGEMVVPDAVLKAIGRYVIKCKKIEFGPDGMVPPAPDRI